MRWAAVTHAQAIESDSTQPAPVLFHCFDSADVRVFGGFGFGINPVLGSFGSIVGIRFDGTELFGLVSFNHINLNNPKFRDRPFVIPRFGVASVNLRQTDFGFGIQQIFGFSKPSRFKTTLGAQFLGSHVFWFIPESDPAREFNSEEAFNSQNHFTLKLEFGAAYYLGSKIRLHAVAGVRHTFGLDRVPGLNANSLTVPYMMCSVTFSRFRAKQANLITPVP
jgi:hypothetical protein